MTNSRKRTFGTVLRAKREARGLSIRALALAAGLNASSVSRLEKDEIGATDETVRRLAKVLKASYTELATLALGSLPHLAPYLRAKYDLSDEAIAELQVHFNEVSQAHRKRVKP